MSESGKPSVICIHEDRADCLTGLKLGVLSLRDKCKHLPIIVSCPNAPAPLVEWLSHQGDVHLASSLLTGPGSWNVKPTVLLALLQEGYPEVIWVDSDIVAHRDVITPLTEQSPATLGGTEETYWGQSQGGTARTVAWGLTPGREMPCTINSSVVRVTSAHFPLLKAWQHMMKHHLYIQSQNLPWYERPLHMISDQEVLTALLGAQEFAGIPLVLLRRGVDIAQCMGPGGFTPWERSRALFLGLPGLVHAMGIKPWMKTPHPPPLELNLAALRRYYEYLHIELTPYVCLARPYGPALQEDLQWMEPVSSTARLLATLTARNANLQEFPFALIDAIVRRLRRWLKIARYALPDEFCLHTSPLDGGFQESGASVEPQVSAGVIVKPAAERSAST